MLKPALSLILVFVAASGSYAQSKSSSDVRQLLDDAVAAQLVGSVVALIAHGDSIVFLEAFGDRGDGTPMPTDAIARVASITKPITAAALMLLEERRQLSLNDSVNRWFPGFGARVLSGNDTVAAARAVTIFDLLTHQAGLIGNGPEYDKLWESADAHEFSTRIGSIPLRFHPGTRFDYGCCGSAYEVLGAIVEKASGKSLKDFFNAELLRPLGMKDTYFFVPAEKQSRLAAQYRKSNSGELLQARRRGEEQKETKYYSGAGGLRSTVPDFFRFARFLLHGGEIDGVRVLSRKSVEKMVRDQVGSKYNVRGFGWGLGLQVRTSNDGRAGPPVGSYGWSGGTGTLFVVDPGASLIAIFFAPTSPGTPGVSQLGNAFVLAAHAWAK